MTVLAVDTSGKIASCAVARDGEIVAFAERDAMLDHSSALLTLCGQLLEQNEIEIGEIDAFAAAAGPGSFTGVRIGVAAVKGFGWAKDKPCAGVSTLLAMACGDEAEGRLCCRVTARAGEYYYAFFERRDGVVARLSDDAVAEAAVVEAQAAKHGVLRFVDDAQNARGVALAALQMSGAGALQSCHAVTPSYLRKPQAQRLLEERNSNSQSNNQLVN